MNRPDSEQPDQGANQDDAVWLDLVARLESDTVALRPDSPDPGEQLAAGTEPAAPERPAQSSFRDFDPLGLAAPPAELSAAQRQTAAGGQDAARETPEGPRDYEVDDDGEEFVPEEPPSLAGTDPLTMLAWLGAVGGPVALLLSAMFWRAAPLMAIVGIVAAFVLGTVYLIMKLPEEKNGDDDGARV
ncbi:hypothetical protein FBY33_2617 [Arthrobacter sp. SLBN-112]|uniref:hypothetical protein n=1 Tax=Arthrobacter sp. SLBN-112 TaxID=2768452 RepID=UPI00114D7718|nr:hypothetical protein [Arthrobacter sp. SLBN-112]TQJ40551.1 hypothetical protein FBY33_2617 [Arthrobacter sp. SLBN-112]